MTSSMGRVVRPRTSMDVRSWPLLFLGLLRVSAWNVENFPNPMEQPELCGRGDIKGWICDPDGLVSREGLNVIEGHIRTIHESAYTCDGAPEHWEVAVAILARVDGTSEAAARVEKFAVALHDKWGVGGRCGGGALLVVSVDDRQARFKLLFRTSSQYRHLIYDVL